MSRTLERSLLFSFAAHGLGMFSMVLFLLPGMPGGGTVDDFVRVHYVASHPWLWRLGWLPWQITAVSDLLIAVALLRTPFVPRLPAVLTLLFTLVAVFFDQLGQVLWITRGIALAQRDGAAYLIYEKRIFAYTAVWGATLYCVSALGWTWALSSARTWNRALTLLSIVLWTLFFTVCIGPLFGMHPKIVAAGNALAFVLLQLWFVLVIEAVIRRSRPTTTHGRFAPFRHPRWRLFDVFANSRFVRACGELLQCLFAAYRQERSHAANDSEKINFQVMADSPRDATSRSPARPRASFERHAAPVAAKRLRPPGRGLASPGPARSNE